MNQIFEKDFARGFDVFLWIMNNNKSHTPTEVNLKDGGSIPIYGSDATAVSTLYSRMTPESKNVFDSMDVKTILALLAKYSELRSSQMNFVPSAEANLSGKRILH